MTGEACQSLSLRENALLPGGNLAGDLPLRPFRGAAIYLRIT
jgi:hypothetical protein